MALRRSTRLDRHRKLRTAVHEAGHAVIGLVMGDGCLVLKRIRLTRAGGYCAWRYRGRGKPDPLVLGVTALGGHAAELEFNYRLNVEEVQIGDHRQVVAIGFRGRSLPTLLAIARGIVADHKSLVLQLALEIVKRDLTGAEVAEIAAEWLNKKENAATRGKVAAFGPH